MIKDLKKYNTLALASIGASVLFSLFIFCYYQMDNELRVMVFYIIAMLMLPSFLGYFAYKGKTWAKWLLLLPVLYDLNVFRVIVVHFSKAQLYCSFFTLQLFFLILAAVLFFIAGRKK